MVLNNEWIAKFIYNSNAIEGIYTAESSILACLVSGFPSKSPLINNQIEAVEWVKTHKKDYPTVEAVCELHGILMKNIDSYAGKLRTFQVYVGGHTPPPAPTLSYYLDRWIQLWGKTPVKSWTKKKVCLFRHYEFEWIHPFTDGNGRVGRLIHLWDCLHNRTDCEMIFLEDRASYYDSLNEYRQTFRDLYIDKWT